MKLRKEVVDRLMLSKSLVSNIRFNPISEPSGYAVAEHVIASHDAAELALGAICDQLGCRSEKDKTYLMDYFPLLKEAKHPLNDVSGKGYFDQLNRVRINIKHLGILPNAKQWARVGEKTFGYISEWCTTYLKISYHDLDASALLNSGEVTERFNKAKAAFQGRDYKSSLEFIAAALDALLKATDVPAIPWIEVGNPRPEDAIRLSGYGVHANDFLALQEFLPRVEIEPETTPIFKWEQEVYGHPGNWDEQSVSFCLQAFLDVALQIQDAKWRPAAISFRTIFEYELTALDDHVEIWDEVEKLQGLGGPLNQDPQLRGKTRIVRQTLQKGEIVRCSIVTYGDKASFPDRLFKKKGDVPTEKVLHVFTLSGLFGRVDPTMVKVTCVPRSTDLVSKFFPNLPEISWDP